ncbi:MAG: hypothetical protein FWG10_12865 [Eubacteriaceae bacterium]|nr:hypothetical protein [Eubacteriaceae bacterium]
MDNKKKAIAVLLMALALFALASPVFAEDGELQIAITKNTNAVINTGPPLEFTYIVEFDSVVVGEYDLVILTGESSKAIQVTIPYTGKDPGTHNITVKEKGNSAADGTISADFTMPAPGGFGPTVYVFNNNFLGLDPKVELVVEVTKNVGASDPRTIGATFQFVAEVFKVNDIGGDPTAVTKIGEVSLPAAATTATGSIALDITGLDAGQYYVKVVEVSASPSPGWTLDTSVVSINFEITTGAPAPVQAVFTNNYTQPAATGNLDVNIEKKIDGDDIDAPVDFEFEVYLNNFLEKTVTLTLDPANTTKTAQVKVKIDNLPIGLHKVSVRETSIDPSTGWTADTSPRNLDVDIVQGLNEVSASFTNTYNMPLPIIGKLAVDITKTIEGDPISVPTTFEFQAMLGTAKAGSVSITIAPGAKSGTGTIQIPDLAPGPYLFKVSEVSATPAAGMTLDTSIIDISIVVNASNPGHLSKVEFKNTYNAPPVYSLNIPIEAQLTDPAASQIPFVYTLALKKAGDEAFSKTARLPLTVEKGSESEKGNVIFFDLEPGTYSLTITQNSSLTGYLPTRVDGVVNNTGVITLNNIVITDANVTYGKRIAFLNHKEKFIEINGEKKLIAPPNQQKDRKAFNFNLYEVDKQGRSILVGTQLVRGSGNFQFRLPYPSKAGTYTYKINETKGADMEYDYDSEVYTLAVVAKDIGNGKLEVSWNLADSTGKKVGIVRFVNRHKSSRGIDRWGYLQKGKYGKTDNPKTGDSTNLALWAALLSSCSAGAAAIAIMRKKSFQQSLKHR